MMCEHEFDWESRTMQFCSKCGQTQNEAHYARLLAAANARIAELEATNQEQTSKMIFMETIFRMPHNVATGTGISFKIATMQEFNRAEMYKERAEQAEANFDDAKDKIAMMGAEIVRLSEGNEQAEAQNKRMREALEELLQSPYVISEATIPKSGIETEPEQVVGTLHVGLIRYRKAKAALEGK